MRRDTRKLVKAAFATVLGILSVPDALSAQTRVDQPFQKEFFDNGYVKSLKQLVHFYNMRDVYAQKVTSGHCPAGTTEAGRTEKVNCWPMPEVPNNIDMRAMHKGRNPHPLQTRSGQPPRSVGDVRTS